MNLMQLRFSYALPVVQTAQAEAEAQGVQLVASATAAWVEATTIGAADAATAAISAAPSYHGNGNGGSHGGDGSSREPSVAELTAAASAAARVAADEALTVAYQAHAAATVRRWWTLSGELLFSFSDG